MTEVCSHGRPDHQELIVQVLDALGMGTHARPMTPQGVFADCLAQIAHLRLMAHPRKARSVGENPRHW